MLLVLDDGFFVFPDISIRIEGIFRLRFTLYEITRFVAHINIDSTVLN
jgi:hypothetical protein